MITEYIQDLRMVVNGDSSLTLQKKVGSEWMSFSQEEKWIDVNVVDKAGNPITTKFQ